MLGLPLPILSGIGCALIVLAAAAINAWRRPRYRYPRPDEIYGEPKGMLWTCYSCGRDHGEHEPDCGARLLR